MVSAIRIYIEGDPALREGFRNFFNPLYLMAQSKKIKIEPPKLCGSRFAAYKAFKTALITYPDSFVVLLVDAKAPVNEDSGSWQHLKLRPGDGWDCLGTDDSQCYLMIQSMEAWFIADLNTLMAYYGQGFQPKSIPRDQVEKVDKQRLTSALEEATKNTKTKGLYHKTRHAPEILSLLKVNIVRKAAPECDRLFTTLTKKINE